MNERAADEATRDVPDDIISRRRLLAVGGVVAAGSLAGCLNRVASSVTNTGASPAAVFAGTQRESAGEFVVGVPHVSRLTPSLSGRVEVEGWITSSPVMAQNHNSSRSNAPGEGYARDADSDDDGLSDGADMDDALVAYLGGEAMVAERFTVCLPDAEVPGGNGSIREAVTPERLLSYLTGESDGDGRVYSWGTPKAGPGDSEGGGDCDDDDPSNHPGAVCGTTPHFVADVTGPVSTSGSMAVIRPEDGSVLVVSLPPGADGGSERVCMTAGDEPCEPGVWARTTESGSSSGVSVYQVLVQPPRCPEPFPALLSVQRCESDDQLVYTGGWVIDDAALYENSATVLSMAGPTQVVGIECCFDYSADADGDGFGDVVKRSVSGERGRRGARLDVGTVDELVEAGVISESGGNDILVRKRPGRQDGESRGEVTGDEYGFVTNVPVDAPVLHLRNAASASNDVKFKAGAELSKSVN